jgi:hypothetical protein
MEKAVASGPGPESSVALVASAGKSGPEAPVKEGSNATDMDDANFLYDRAHFLKYKV